MLNVRALNVRVLKLNDDIDCLLPRLYLQLQFQLWGLQKDRIFHFYLFFAYVKNNIVHQQTDSLKFEQLKGRLSFLC